MNVIDRIAALSDEQTGDLATIALIAVLFALLTFLTIRRTWRWDALGRALTAVCAGLTVAYVLTIHRMLWPDAQPAEVRWLARGVIIVSAIAAIIALLRDEPSR